MVRISSVTILFLISILCLDTMAQQPKAHFDIDTGIFSGPPLVIVNGKVLTSDFWRPGRYEIADQMKDNPRAFELATKHQEYANWAGLSLWGGLGVAITYLFTTDNVNYGVYWGIFGTGLVSSLVLKRSSMIYLRQAMDAYNGVNSSQSTPFNFVILPIKNGATLGLAYTF